MKKVLILLANGFEVYEAAAFVDVLGWADAFGSEPIQSLTAGLSPTLRCTFGFEVIPQTQLSDVDVGLFDALAIPGGFQRAGFYEDAYSTEFLDIIRRFSEERKPIASICVGALPLGRSGILKGRRATTYHLLQGKWQKELASMGVSVVDQEPMVRDGNIITSTSPATALGVAFALLEELTSLDNAHRIRELMGFTPENTTCEA